MKTVLVGGCFDLLHKGHITFLKKAKEGGEKLVVLLESDEKIKKLKGEGRPIQSQKIRVEALEKLGFIDEVISLPFLETEKEYDEVVKNIKPDIIAVTERYPGIAYHKRSAKLVGAKLKYVSKAVGGYSTSGLLSKKIV